MLTQAFTAFDDYNAKDPNQESFNGKSYPKEYLYALRMTEHLHQFYPEAPIALQLAARCQHIGRWEIARNTYPMDKVGYLTWRNELKKHHAAIATAILKNIGFDEEIIETVTFLLLKKQLKKNPLTQALEDVVCLVFLDYYFDEFATKYEEEKLIDIVQKTWAKMSDQGHEAALQLNYTPSSLALIQKALSA